MSIPVLDAVWKHSKLKGSSLLIMLALADWSDDEGRSYPSVSRLAKKGRISDRQAQKQIAQICASGELEVHVGMGPVSQGGRSNLYRIKLERYRAQKGVSITTPPVADNGVSSRTQRGVIQGSKGVSSATPNTSENRQYTSSVRARVSDRSEKPADVDEATWRDFVAVLTAKRKVATPTFLAELEQQGNKAGLALADVIKVCAARQWASFDASWTGATPSAGQSATFDLQTKGGIDAAASRLNMERRADEHWPLFADRVRAEWAAHLGAVK